MKQKTVFARKVKRSKKRQPEIYTISESDLGAFDDIAVVQVLSGFRTDRVFDAATPTAPIFKNGNRPSTVIAEICRDKLAVPMGLLNPDNSHALFLECDNEHFALEAALRLSAAAYEKRDRSQLAHFTLQSCGRV